jgi:hypothetical protein
MNRAFLIVQAILLGSVWCNSDGWAQIAVASGPPIATYGNPSSTVAALPACTAALNGKVYTVTDALAPTPLATIVGGGAVQLLVHCNGTNWLAG